MTSCYALSLARLKPIPAHLLQLLADVAQQACPLLRNNFCLPVRLGCELSITNPSVAPLLSPTNKIPIHMRSFALALRSPAVREMADGTQRGKDGVLDSGARASLWGSAMQSGRQAVGLAPGHSHRFLE